MSDKNATKKDHTIQNISQTSSIINSNKNNIIIKKRKKYSYQQGDYLSNKYNLNQNENININISNNQDMEPLYEDEYQGLMYCPRTNDIENIYYSIENEDDNSYKTKWKTEICRYWEMYGQCKFGDNCAFAHGDSELKKRKMTFNYKTKQCKQFFELGYCSYGSRCQFSHKKENSEKNNNFSYLKIIKEFLSSENEISHELVKRPRLMTFEKITKSTLEESQKSKLKLYEDIINLKNCKFKLSEDTNYSNISNDKN